MGKRWMDFYVLENFITVPARHEYVRKRQVRANIGDLAQRCFAITHGNDVNALIFQGEPHHLLDVAVVIRNQNLGHRTSSGDTLPARATPDVWPYKMPALEYWS